MSTLISIVVPCYNEEQALPLLLNRIESVAPAWQVDYEIVCVDDGSTDATWAVIEARAARTPRLRGIRLSRNFGQQVAVSAGFYFSAGSAVAVMDADLQDPPEVVVDLVNKWLEGYQVVHAVRSHRQDAFLKRVFASAFYRVLSWIAPFRIPREAGEFVLLDRVVVDILVALPEQDRYLRGLRAWCGFRQAEVTYRREARAAGRPQYTFWKSLNLALDGLVAFSTRPLRLATYAGLLSVALSLLVSGLALIRSLLASAPSPTTFPVIVVLVLLLGGAQLLCLGIIGEYLGRIAQQVRGRPLWITSETIGVNDGPSLALYPTTAARVVAGGGSTADGRRAGITPAPNDAVRKPLP
jgi:dolichol-phosphate mannosyltransferase